MLLHALHADIGISSIVATRQKRPPLAIDEESSPTGQKTPPPASDEESSATGQKTPPPASDEESSATGQKTPPSASDEESSATGQKTPPPASANNYKLPSRVFNFNSYMRQFKHTVMLLQT